MGIILMGNNLKMVVEDWYSGWVSWVIQAMYCCDMTHRILGDIYWDVECKSEEGIRLS